MNAKKVLLKEFDETVSQLLHVIASFKQADINIILFEGSWTAAQVAEHVLKSNAGVLEIIHSKVDKAERDADEKREAIKKLFRDFSISLQSPETIIPSDLPQEKAQLRDFLKTKLTALHQAAETPELSMICLNSEFPGLGLLSRLEWLYFCIHHTKRHIRQLKNISNKIKF